MATSDITRGGLMDEMQKFHAEAGLAPNVLVLPASSWKLVSKFGGSAETRAPMDSRIMNCRVRLLDDAACPQELVPEAESVPMAYFSYEGS
jgi:hypothetical protein